MRPHQLLCSYSVNGVPDAEQGSGPYGSTILFVHRGTSELGVTAIAPLAKCERLASALLPHF